MRRSLVYCFLILMFGCSSSDVMKIPDQSYFPLRVGNFWIYQVNETDIQRLICSDNSQTDKNYQLKEQIVDSTKNTEGRYTYTIHRYTRPDQTQPWVDLNTWSAKMSSNLVVVDEGNIPYVKLTFPFVNDATWNGNLYNDLGDELYTLDSLAHTFTVTSGEKFKNTLTVVQSDNKDFIVYQDKRFEVYAPSVGLIFKSTIQLHYFFVPQDCSDYQKVKDGIIYSQSLISYGRQ